MTISIKARDLIPGDTFKGRTPYGVVTYMVTYVQADDEGVVIHTLREYQGQVANDERWLERDHIIGGKR
jgi:uncharacterized protein YbaA (DUF1428 family)